MMMKSDLTKRYAGLFEKKGLTKLFHFARDVARSGKLREFSSFIVWELYHRFKFFPKQAYIEFSALDTVSLKSGRINSPGFDEKVQACLTASALHVTRCELNWKLLFIHGDEIFGCFYPNDCDLYKSVNGGKSVIFLKRFPEKIRSVFVSSQGAIFVGTKGSVYRSADHGTSFHKAIELGSYDSFIRFNNGMTELPDKTLIIGEYGNVWDNAGWRKLAYLYLSDDDGQTWKRSDYLIKKGTNKHVHIVRYSSTFDRLYVADGDNYKKLWVNDTPRSFDINHPEFKAVNRFHIQMGGYTSMAECDGKVYFGTDYQGGTNFIVETADGANFVKKVVPDPYRRSPIDNMVVRTGKNGVEIWANLPYSTANTKCLLMYTRDGGNTWNKVIEYNGATHKVWILNTSNDPMDALYFSIQDLVSYDRVVYKVTD